MTNYFDKTIDLLDSVLESTSCLNDIDQRMRTNIQKVIAKIRNIKDTEITVDFDRRHRNPETQTTDDADENKRQDAAECEKITESNVSQDDAVPSELDQDPVTRLLYQKALEEGKEKDNTARVMVIGCFSQGKTTLVNNLMGVSTTNVETTNGIDIHHCEYHKDRLVWTKAKSEDQETESISRIVSVALSDMMSEEDLPLETDIYVRMQPANKGGSKAIENIKSHNIARGTEEGVFPLIANESCGSAQGQSESQAFDTYAPRIDTEKVKTFSIQLKTRSKHSCDRNERKKLSIWDFGGQFVYYATHQLFHSENAIYLLVFDLSKGLDTLINDNDNPNKEQKKMKVYIRLWITSVHAFVGYNEGNEPKIILVGTHKDQLESNTDVDALFEEVRQLFDGTKMSFHIFEKHFVVSDSGLDQDIVDLRKTVQDLAVGQSENRIIPAKWIPLETRLMDNREKKIVTLQKVMEWGSENEIPIKEEEQIKLFLKYHHSRGMLFYFDDNVGPHQYVVLDPQFLIDAFKCVITSERHCLARPELRQSWNKLRNHAELERKLLSDVWKGEFAEFQDVLLFFLERHRIIAEALEYIDPSDSTVPQPLGFYIVPSLLKKANYHVVESFLKDKRTTLASLSFDFEHAAVLLTVFNRITAAAMGRWPLVKYRDISLIFEDASAFRLSLNQVGLLKLTGNSLELVVVGPRDSVEVCDHFRRFIEAAIQHEIQKHQNNMSNVYVSNGYTISARCLVEDHKGEYIGSREKIDLTDLKNCPERVVICPDFENHTLIIDDILKEWYKSEISAVTIPKRKLTNKELSTLSMRMEGNWQHLGHQLGLSKAAVEQIEQMSNRSLSLKVYKLLCQWDEKAAEDATLDELIKAVNACKDHLVVHHDVMKNLVDDIQV